MRAADILKKQKAFDCGQLYVVHMGNISLTGLLKLKNELF